MSMDQGEDVMHVVAGPVVESAEPFDRESHTAELPQPGVVEELLVEADDPLVPRRDSGMRGWAGRVGGVLGRCFPALLPIGVVAALPMHFFVGRVDDTVVAAPALADLAGGVGLLLLPMMWVAYFAVSALPLVICLAGAVAVALHQVAAGALPRPGTGWRLVAYRLRRLWAWFAVFGLLTQSLPLLLTADRLGAAVAAPLAVALGAVATGVLTFTGMLGCVVLIERGHGPRRALHLCSLVRPSGLIAVSLLVTVLPRVADAAWGAVAATVAAIGTALLWSVSALVTYAQARRAEGPVTGRSLHDELAAAEFD
jgi:hypothetical protein